MSGSVLVLGASSAIGRAVAAALARRGYGLVLAARDLDDAERLATDLALRHGVATAAVRFDAEDLASHAAVLAGPPELAGVVLAFALDAPVDSDFAEARRVLEVNVVATASVLHHAAARLERQGRGFIVGLASIAGDRGRPSNYVYGASKGAMALLLQGLRGRLHRRGVKVLTVKPGFVDTRQTFGKPGVFLAADPAEVGERIVRALERGRDVVYIPGFWRFVSLALRAIPERWFKRLPL